jgi:phosphate-transporting ATPase
MALTVGDAAALTLSVAGGECVVIAGPSGSGKSRLLRAIADLDPGPGDRPGVIRLGGIDHLDYSGSEWRRRVAYLASESQWWLDDVAGHFPAPPLAEDLQRLDLSAQLLQQPVRRLSTGERQRLALLRLLAGRPRVLLLDEPTASLDPRATQAVERLVTDYRVANGVAVLWVSHDVDQARRVADRYLYFDHGDLRETAVGAVGSA